jgi:hypothetical protein
VKYLRYLAFLSMAALMWPAVAMARNSNEHTVAIPDSVQVGSVHLKAGTYKVEWKQSGPNVQVTFLQHGKAVASVPGILQTNDKQVTEDDTITAKTAANVTVLKEIDFGHQKEALLLSPRGT